MIGRCRHGGMTNQKQTAFQSHSFNSELDRSPNAQCRKAPLKPVRTQSARERLAQSVADIRPLSSQRDGDFGSTQSIEQMGGPGFEHDTGQPAVAQNDVSSPGLKPLMENKKGKAP